MADLVGAATDELWSWLDRPFALFGHSLGALVAFEVARRLRHRRGPEPRHVFLSGRRAPHLAERYPPMAHLDDVAFVTEVRRRYNGISEEVLQHADLMELLLPTLRADIKAFEAYTYEPGEPLGSPITAYGGDQDPGSDGAKLRPGVSTRVLRSGTGSFREPTSSYSPPGR
jgi:medium-chain acyl-[acyl-carrier-protein] hydrolase